MGNTETERWYAMRVVGYKADGKIRQMLAEAGIRFFQPMHDVVHKVRGRVVHEVVPIVGGLFFTYGKEADIMVHTTKSMNRFQFLIPRGGRATDRIVIGNDEMENFIRVVESQCQHEYIGIDEARTAVGKKVRIIGGVFDGVVGKLVAPPRGRKKTLIVEVEGLLAVSVQITPEMMEVLND